jgi:hypothetical protein
VASLEYEIVYIVKISGIYFTCTIIEPFSNGYLTLVGSYLPRMYHNGDACYDGNPDLRVNLITVQFSNDSHLNKAHGKTQPVIYKHISLDEIACLA